MTHDSLMCLVIFQALMITANFLWEGTGYLDSTEIHKNPVTHETHISHPCDTHGSAGATPGIVTWMQ